jgi:beta-galactosidase/beta-glucuronidase
LIEAELTVTGAAGTDHVSSYTAIRSVGVERGHVGLNGRPVALRLALDQGYWPDCWLTAPSVDALRRDVALIRELGLHGVRKHQKIEDPRWLAACDELGVLVWEELPSAYPFTVEGAAALVREWTDVIERDRSHPCIVAWVPVNESWACPTSSTTCSSARWSMPSRR